MKICRKSDIIEAVRFDVNRWLYERASAYPMVESRPCAVGESSLGGYFTYEPIIPLKDGYIRLNYGDYILTDGHGVFYTCGKEAFSSLYETIIEP